ncbi:YkyB family protein [Gracilibacillus marinus]|uniref:YkyB family protein n=1 Tax=Gracilibacillus marinus TaxID=630535 RepID=A0ABV8VST2_9BACI
MEETPNKIGQALFIVNRHAKTAPDPSYLYQLKNATMEKLLKEKKALKVGLHYSNNPKRSRQHSVILVQVGEYYFHMPPSKEDMKQLQHLGQLDSSYRNPKTTLSLTIAKKILMNYLNWNADKLSKPRTHSTTSYPFHSTYPTTLSPFYHKRNK